METDGRVGSGKCRKGLIFIITTGPTDWFIKDKACQFSTSFFAFSMVYIEDRFITGECKYIWTSHNWNRNKEIDAIEYRESLGISCFQGFLAIYSYKEKVVRVDDFY